MNVERSVRLIAGIFVLTGVALAYFVHPWFIGLTVFVGLNLAQSSLTGFCPAEMILRKLGVPSGCEPVAKPQ
jgi:hypothetical protein